MPDNSLLCERALQRPLNQIDNAVTFSTIASIVVFIAVGFLFAYWLRRWTLMKPSLRRIMWSNLGWFAFLGLTGNITGAIARGAYLADTLVYSAAVSNQSSLSGQSASQLYAQHCTWRAVYYMAQSIESPCLMLAKALVLSRLIAHASLPMQHHVHTPWHYSADVFRRLSHSLVIMACACGAVGLVANIIALVYAISASRLYYAAAALGDSSDFHIKYRAAVEAFDGAETANSVQNVSELVSVLCIMATFAVVAPMCARIMRLGEEQISNSAAKSKLLASLQTNAAPPQAQAVIMAKEMMDRAVQTAQLQRRLIVAAAWVVLVAFLPRAGLLVLRAYINFQNNVSPACGTCGTCQTAQHLVHIWYVLTPEIPVIISCVSSPVPLAACLWCMLSTRDRYRLRNNVSESDDGIERGAALARDRMHINLPNTSLFSSDNSATPMLRPFINS